MTFLLNSQNLFNYLVESGICTQSEQEQSQIELIGAKNFNLLLSLPDGRKLMIKQERHNQQGKTAGEFWNEWRIQQFLRQFPELSHLRPLFPEVLHFDAENSIIVFKYLTEHRDLSDFYTKEKIFPAPIASAIGASLGKIHRSTFNRQDYRDFFNENREKVSIGLVTHLVRNLERIGPEIFGQVPTDGLHFFALYQRYDSLGEAVAELSTALQPCCLTHNDFKLNNILLHNDWEQLIYQAESSENSIVRLIDWERSTWGDPAFDLGTIIASYLQIWLNSMIVSKAISIEESLRLAATPLELLQSSITALASAYFDNFPEILEHRPDFVKRVVQFSGLGLIQTIQATIQYQKSFGNTGISMLQVAKSLLCRPEQSISTVFGVAESELIRLSSSSLQLTR